MSRTLTSPRCQVWSSTWRSSLPSASRATSLGRRNPRNKNRGAFISTGILCGEHSDVNRRLAASRSAMNLEDLRLIDELHVDSVRNDASFVAFGEQAAHGLTAAFAVIEREIVHPHCHKAIRERRIHLAGELHGVLQSIFAIVERILDALFQQP